MTKRLLATTAALALVALYGATAHAANTDTGGIEMMGDVDDTCTLDDGTESGTPANAGFDTGTLTVTNLADATTAVGSAFSIDIDFAAMCNFHHNVELESTSNGMIVDALPTAVHGTFDYRVNYTATLSHDEDAACAGGVEVVTNGSLTNNTGAENADDADVDAACNGTLTVGVVASAGTNPLLSGDYADTLTLTVGPQVE